MLIISVGGILLDDLAEKITSIVARFSIEKRDLHNIIAIDIGNAKFSDNKLKKYLGISVDKIG